MKHFSNVIIALILLAVVGSVVAIDPPASVCSFAGFFRNPTDCTRFYRCVEVRTTNTWSIYHFQCPEGTVFDQGIQVCNFPWSSPPCFPFDNVVSASTPRPSFPNEPQGGTGSPVVPGGGGGVTVVSPGGGGGYPIIVNPPPGIQFPDQGVAPGLPVITNPGGGGSGTGTSQDGSVGDESYPDGGFPFAPPGTFPDYGDDYDLSNYPDYSVTDDGSGSSIGASGGPPSGGSVTVPGSSTTPSFPLPGLDQENDFGAGAEVGTGGQRPVDQGTSDIHFPKPPFGGSGSGSSSSSGISVPKPPFGTTTNRPTSGGSHFINDDDPPPLGLGDNFNPLVPGPGSGTSKPPPSGTTTGPFGVFIPTTTARPPVTTSGNADEDKNANYEVYPESIFNCPAPGFFAFESNCHEFYVCQEVLPGKLLADQLYRCPSRYLFDEVTRRCQREEKVNCNKFTYSATQYSQQSVMVSSCSYVRSIDKEKRNNNH